MIHVLVALFLLLWASPAYAAITLNALTSGSDSTDATSYTTASVTPTVDRLVLVAVRNGVTAGTPNIPTLTGNSLTYVQVATTTFATSGVRRITVFRAMGTPTSGTIVIDFAGQTQLDGVWSVVEFVDVNTGGTNGSSAAVQSATNSVINDPSLTVTLGAFANAANATYGAFATTSGADVVPGSGFAEIHDLGAATLFTEWRNDNDLTVDASDVTLTDRQWGGIAVEIGASGDTTAPAVSITAPAASATVSGSIAVTATATDAVGVEGVQFRLDGNTLEAEDTTSPYAITWNTTGASNGAHSLTAVARDAAGNSTTSAAVSVTVTNTTTDCVNTGLPGTPYPGVGAAVTGGAGQTVVTVTNLNNSGAGSLREALSAGSRCIKFTGLSGTIPLTSGIAVQSNVTIDGWTAASPGITITCPTCALGFGGVLSVNISSGTRENIIIRGIRLRQAGDPATGHAGDGIRLRATQSAIVQDIVVDHVSCDQGTDGCIDIVADDSTSTMQRVLVSETIISRTMLASLVDGGCEIQFFRVLFHGLDVVFPTGTSGSGGQRQPDFSTPFVFTCPSGAAHYDLRNSIIWGWVPSATRIDADAGTSPNVNIVNNYYSRQGGDPLDAIVITGAGTPSYWIDGNVSADAYVFETSNAAAEHTTGHASTLSACVAGQAIRTGAGVRGGPNAFPLDAIDAATIASIPGEQLPTCPSAVIPPDPASGSTIVEDTFTEAEVALTAHVPSPTGTSWSEIENTGSTFLETKGTNVGADAAGADVRIVMEALPAPSVAEYDQYLVIPTLSTGGNGMVFLYGRRTNSTTFYALIARTGTNTATNFYLVEASGTVPITSAGDLATAQVTWEAGNMMLLEIRDGSQKGYKCTTSVVTTCALVLSAQDTTITSAGSWGFGMGNIRTSTDDVNSSVRVDDYKAVEEGSAPAAGGKRSANSLGLDIGGF